MSSNRQEGAMRRRLVSLLAAGLAVAAAGLVVTGSAVGFNPTPEPPQVVPLSGAHWQADAGLPDANGNAQIGLVQNVTTDGHTDVALLHNFKRLPTSAIQSIGFAVGPLPNGINPCWLVEFTGPDGTQGMVHVVASADRRDMTRTDLGGGVTQWTWTPETLPAGTIDRVVIGVMAAATPLPDTGVVFDDFSANGLTATKGGS
jgi:hypothetical protein